MQLTSEQSKALDAIHAWAHEGWRSSVNRPYFILAGYAGTGKTVLTQEFINSQTEQVLCCAPTGKAASVLEKRLKNATVSTIHRALYKPVPPSMDRLIELESQLEKHPDNLEIQEAVRKERERLSKKDLSFRLNEDRLIQPGQLVIIDESSMVTKRMHRDLLDTKARILYVGDPGQLPPVRDEGFFQAHAPDAMLENVQRQALDSPIIYASMRVRNGEEIQRTSDDAGAFRKLPKTAIPAKEWLAWDQVITGTNMSRQRINRFFRGQYGFKSWWPEDGDKLICLKNDMDAEACFINGIQALSVGAAKYNPEFQEIQGDIFYEDEVVKAVSFYRYPFQAHYDPAAEELPWQIRNGMGLREFDYAYCITVHKAQGSEFNKVIIADDGMNAGSKEFRRKWLYTAITRAKSELLWLY